MHLLLFALVCFAGAELGSLTRLAATGLALPVFAPAVGILVGALVLAARRRWTMLVPTACGVMILSLVLHGRPVLPSVALGATAAAEGLLAAWLLRRVLHERFSMSLVPHVWALIVVAALVPMAGGVLTAGLLDSASGLSFTAAWRAWWLMEGLGILLATPIAAGALTQGTAPVQTAALPRTIETAVVLAGAAVMAESVFGSFLDPLVSVPAYLLPFLMWSAFRLGPGSTAATLFVVCLIGLWNTAHGRGPFALPASPIEWILRSQGAAGISAVSFLLLAAVVAERKRITQENARLVAQLQQALAEIKTLRGFIPICAWCHNVRDDAGFWQQIESYLGAKTDATFSHSICPACEELAHAEIDAHADHARE
jgi:integral membrane sensor domain MASE1